MSTEEALLLLLADLRAQIAAQGQELEQLRAELARKETPA